MNEDRILAWHFLPEDERLRYEPRTKVIVGKTLSADGPILICNNGMHASVRAIDALAYAPGPIICRVEVWGETANQEDKIVGRSRRCLAKADATNVLHEFACLCAERALRTAKVEDRLCWEAIETKRKWLRGEATDEQLSAAWSAARSARSAARSAESAARSAAESAARSAAWSAARSAAESAARSAAWSAESAARSAARSAESAAWSAARSAESAARSAQNDDLERLLLELLGSTNRGA